MAEHRLAADQKKRGGAGKPSCFLTNLAVPTASDWAARGPCAVTDRWSKRTDADRRVLSSIGVLTLTGSIYTMHVDGSITSALIVKMLKHVLRYLPEGFVVIWDGASTHRSKVTKAFLAQHPEIAVEALPPYAPELNPEEYSHGNVKARNRNSTPADKVQMRDQLHRGFRRLRRRKDLLLSFIRHAGLTVKQLWRS
jgi:transposase